MKKKSILIAIVIAMFISVFLHLVKYTEVPPCFNADEASFGYNAYSILKTGKDEYGVFLPLRLKAFGEDKMPLYAYLAVPSIAVFGLNEFSVRFPNVVLGVLLVPLMYLVTMELFKKEKIALIASYLTALCPAVYILSRHAHEGVAATFLILTAFLFLLKWVKNHTLPYFLLTNFFILLSTFAYFGSRLYLLAFIAAESYIIVKMKLKKTLLLVLVLIFLFSYGLDFIKGANRVGSLLFIRNAGFQLRLNEYLNENNNRVLHNKIAQGITEVVGRYGSQISSTFLLVNGDNNQRFGFGNMGLITPLEYVLLFVGIGYLFIKKERHRYLLVGLLLVAPLTNALTWQDPSITRSYTFFFALFMIVSYAVVQLWELVQKNRFKKTVFILIALLFYGLFMATNWDLYLLHYPKRAQTRLSWQCGYRELSSYVRDNYDKYDHFYITRAVGQPYIYTLFYLQFDPAKYQKQANLSAPDEYGFGQVLGFDKFVFDLSNLPVDKNSVAIGLPEDFQSRDLSGYNVSTISGPDSRFEVVTKPK